MRWPGHDTTIAAVGGVVLFLGGLVAITAPCCWVDPKAAIIIGGIAGVIVRFGVDVIEWLRIDDPIGAVAVHGSCGIFGTLSIGLLAAGVVGGRAG